MDALGSIYIHREGSEKNRENTLELIKQRQELIEQTGKYNPFLVYAEGGTSNGSGIIKFKKGAFFAEKAIRPMFLKYKWNIVCPAFDIIEAIPLMILHLSWIFYRCNVRIMPDFHPNEFLFTHHADKGTERWEIYAWAVRDAMIKCGSFDSIDAPLKLKRKYEAHMRMVPGALDPSKDLNEMLLPLTELKGYRYSSPSKSLKSDNDSD